MSTLVFYVDIGNEDGPSFSYILHNGPSKHPTLNVTYLDDSVKFTPGIWIYNNLSNIFQEYNIIDIIEVHDWYDYLNKQEAKQLEEELCSRYNNFTLIAPNNQQYILVTVNQYDVIPRKYLIPAIEFKVNLSVADFINSMYKYQVETTYKRLLSIYYITRHYCYNYDLVDEDEEEEVIQAIKNTELIQM